MLMQAYEDTPCGYKTSFIIDYPATASGKKKWACNFGLNSYYSGKHWAKRKEDADYWHMLTIAALSKAKIRRKPFDKPVVITFYWDDNLDIDNHSVMGKMIVDALKGRLLRDDNRKWVKGVSHLFHESSYIRVVIQEVSE